VRIASVEAIPAGTACYVRITTEDGTSGVGESTFFGWPTAVAEIVRSFEPFLKGKDATDVEHHWLALYRSLSFRGMAISGAISAVDQALWDLRGKRFEVPVWQLLGGRARRAVRAMRVVDTGTLEVVGVRVGSAGEAVRLLRGSRSGAVGARLVSEVIIDADAAEIPVGIDGEAVMMPTPVRCAIRPAALTVRVPRNRPGVPAPRARMNWAQLWQLAGPAVRLR